MLNTVSLVSIYFFDWLLLPLAQGQQKWLHRNVGWFYQVLWLLPVVGISFYLNVSPRSCALGCYMPSLCMAATRTLMRQYRCRYHRMACAPPSDAIIYALSDYAMERAMITLPQPATRSRSRTHLSRLL